ncbi:MAG: AEC family transporter [Hespellia sp.]|nr:AEC family transporter [Hespellia sp.]
MNFTDLFNLQIMMFIMMGIGFFLRKKDIITTPGKLVLTDLVIDLILPCNIISAFCMEFSKEILMQGLAILIISCLNQVMCVILAYTLYRKFPKEQKMVLQYGTICSNAGFLGNPVAEGIYGPIGLLYASIYLIPQRIIMWSAGVSFFTESPNKKTLAKKVLTHPCIVAVLIGIVLMVSQIQLPVFLGNTIDNIGDCTTAIVMILIGAILAEADIKTMVTKTTAGYSLLRLIIIPVIVLIGCKLAGMSALVTGLSTILAAMPAGTTTVILAVKYNGDEEFATKCVVLTTVLSMIMIPIWCFIISAVY